MAQQFTGDPAPSEEPWGHLRLPPPTENDGPRWAEMMTASEQMYFLGAPLAHVLAYEQHIKAARARSRRSDAGRLSRAIQWAVESLPALNPAVLPESACAA